MTELANYKFPIGRWLAAHSIRKNFGPKKGRWSTVWLDMIGMMKFCVPRFGLGIWKLLGDYESREVAAPSGPTVWWEVVRFFVLRAGGLIGWFDWSGKLPQEQHFPPQAHNELPFKIRSLTMYLPWWLVHSVFWKLLTKVEFRAKMKKSWELVVSDDLIWKAWTRKHFPKPWLRHERSQWSPFKSSLKITKMWGCTLLSNNFDEFAVFDSIWALIGARQTRHTFGLSIGSPQLKVLSRPAHS
jgi:hypothetical protein